MEEKEKKKLRDYYSKNMFHAVKISEKVASLETRRQKMMARDNEMNRYNQPQIWETVKRRYMYSFQSITVNTEQTVQGSTCSEKPELRRAGTNFNLLPHKRSCCFAFNIKRIQLQLTLGNADVQVS